LGDFDGEDGRQASTGAAFTVQQTVLDNLGLIVALVMLGLLIFLAFVILSLISQGALAESVAAIDWGESRSFSSAWRAGLSNFWPVLGQVVLFILIGLGFLLVIGIPVVAFVFGIFAATGSTGLRMLFVVPAVLVAIVLLIIVFIPMTVISQFALRKLVVGGKRLVAAIGSGYRLLATASSGAISGGACSCG
jgi:hypothetical protein